ncbi:MAG TPA: hypothetical protein VL949_00440 [Geobacteraceae bacterium]|nr:hypothetical protein [Geobacteraceae bacterium]
MAILHMTMIIAGLAAVAWGLPAAHRLRPPWDTLAAIAVLFGLVIALLGTLLLIVPDFFKG